MSVRRFIGYFLALSACATIAFASSLMDQAAAQDSPATEGSLPTLSASPVHLHLHKSLPRHLQVALAE